MSIIIFSFIQSSLYDFQLVIVLIIFFFVITQVDSYELRIRPPCTKTVNDRFFLRISPYASLYDTEIYDRNTITCKPSYFAIYGRLRTCLFDLGIVHLVFLFFLEFFCLSCGRGIFSFNFKFSCRCVLTLVKDL